MKSVEGDPKPSDRVFRLHDRFSMTFKRDLIRARIEPVDALGRKLDFHALRKTFATRLAQRGVSQRVAQELLRPQDANLTAQVYTDTTHLPTFDAVARREWEGSIAGADTQIDPQNLGSEGLGASRCGTRNGSMKTHKLIENRGQSHVRAGSVTPGRMAERGGFEPPVGY